MRAMRRLPSVLAAGLLLTGLGCPIPIAAVAQEGAQRTGRTVALNGMEMYYKAFGEGEPLVLLHGFGGSGHVWAEVVPAYAPHFRVIVPDLRGHGRSTNPSGEFTHRQSALDVFALLDSLGVDRFRAVGNSTGGMTLLHMATRQPNRIEAMVLIAATSYFPEQARRIMERSRVESLTPEDFERRRQIHRHGDEQIRMLRRQFHAFKDSYDDMNFTPPYLSTITARTLILHGDRDQFFPVEIALEMYRAIPDSYLWIVPNGRHGIRGDPAVQWPAPVLEFLTHRH
jgi:pimeloyl-ACP methyl ester carboxylesterase